MSVQFYISLCRLPLGIFARGRSNFPRNLISSMLIHSADIKRYSKPFGDGRTEAIHIVPLLSTTKELGMGKVEDSSSTLARIWATRGIAVAVTISEVRQLWPQADHLLLSRSAEVRNACIWNPNSPYAFVAVTRLTSLLLSPYVECFRRSREGSMGDVLWIGSVSGSKDLGLLLFPAASFPAYETYLSSRVIEMPVTK